MLTHSDIYKLEPRLLHGLLGVISLEQILSLKDILIVNDVIKKEGDPIKKKGLIDDYISTIKRNGPGFVSYRLSSKDISFNYINNYLNDSSIDVEYCKKVAKRIVMMYEDKLINNLSDFKGTTRPYLESTDAFDGTNNDDLMDTIDIILRSEEPFMSDIKDNLLHHLNKKSVYRELFEHTSASYNNIPFDTLVSDLSNMNCNHPIKCVLKFYQFCKDKFINTNTVYTIDESYNIMESTSYNKGFLKKAQLSGVDLGPYLCVIRLVEGRLFQAVFSDKIVDDNMSQMFVRRGKGIGASAKNSESCSVRDLLDRHYDNYRESLRRSVEETALEHDIPFYTLFEKEIENNMPCADNSITGIIKNILKSACSNILFRRIAFQHEVMNAVISGFGKTPKYNYYYLGKCDRYDAVTLTLINNVLEKFTSTFYSIAYYEDMDDSDEIFCKDNYFKGDGICVTSFRSVNSNTFKWKSTLVFNLFSWIMHEAEYRLISQVDQDIITRCALISSINKDTFAQLADQTRYFYVAAPSPGIKISKLLDKNKIHKIRHLAELSYLLNQYRMFIFVHKHALSNDMRSISEQVITAKPCIKVAMPHVNDIIANFDYQVSSMYVSNIYNKDRADKLNAESLVYLQLIEEQEIYESVLDKDSISNVKDLFDISLYDEYKINDLFRNIDEHADAIIENVELGSRRFTANFIILLCNIWCIDIPSEEVIRSLVSNHKDSLINLCTLKGGMSGTKVTKDSQSSRAFSVGLEFLDRTLKYGLKDGASIMASGSDYITTLHGASVNELEGSGYACRIVSKDQKGHREISALNAAMRVGARFAENIAHDLNKFFPNNVLNNPNKASIYINTVSKMYESRSNVNKIVFSNSDQSRWGPNNRVELFSLLFTHLLGQNGYSDLFNRVMFKFYNKIAKFPEQFIKHIDKEKYFFGLTTAAALYRKTIKYIRNDIYGMQFKWGMFQGILHDVSSIYHSFVDRGLQRCVKKYMNKEGFIHADSISLITSDDSFYSVVYSHPEDKTVSFYTLSDLENKYKGTFNVIRNESKSVISDQVAEFNSIFILRNSTALPTLKWRIASIDCGVGSDPIEDITSALNRSNNFISYGGSIIGAYVIQTCNIILAYKQWHYYDNYEARLKALTEFGGTAFIDPLVSFYSGSFGNLYAKANYSRVMNKGEYADYYASNFQVELSSASMKEYSRSWYDIRENDFDLLVVTGATGLVSLKKFYRKQAIVVSKHRDIFLNEDKFEPTLSEDAITLGEGLHILSKRFYSKSFHDSSLDLKYHYRYADAMINKDRDVLKIERDNVLTRLIKDKFKKNVISFNDFAKIPEIVNMNEIRSRFKQEDFSLLKAFILSRFINLATLADAVMDYEKYCRTRMSMRTPSHRAMVIELDSSVTESNVFLKCFFLKSYAGKNSESIIKKTGYNYDDIKVSEGTSKCDSKAIVKAEQFVNNINRIIKRQVKGIFKVKSVDTNWLRFIKEMYLCQFSELAAARDEGGFKIKKASLSRNSGILEFSSYLDEAYDEIATRVVSSMSGYRHDAKYKPIFIEEDQLNPSSSFIPSETSNFAVDLRDQLYFRIDTLLTIASYSKCEVRASFSDIIRAIKDDKSLRGSFFLGDNACNITSGFHTELLRKGGSASESKCLVMNIRIGNEWTRYIFVPEDENEEFELDYIRLRDRIPKYEAELLDHVAGRKFRDGDEFTCNEDRVKVMVCKGELTGTVDVIKGTDVFIFKSGEYVLPIRKVRINKSAVTELFELTDAEPRRAMQDYEETGRTMELFIKNISIYSSWAQFKKLYDISSDEDAVNTVMCFANECAARCKAIKSYVERNEYKKKIRSMYTVPKKDTEFVENLTTSLLKDNQADFEIDFSGGFAAGIASFIETTEFEGLEEDSASQFLLSLLGSSRPGEITDTGFYEDFINIAAHHVLRVESLSEVTEKFKPMIVFQAIFRSVAGY